MLRTEAIKVFLTKKTHPDLAASYNADMEVQVNVARGNGTPVTNEYKGKRWVGYTDGVTQWKAFRIPFNANSEPTYEDSKMGYDIFTHAEGVGMTGWDWKHRVSKWVGFDFDALVGHSDNHTQKLTADELKAVQDAVQDIPWVSVRLSTSGRGLHLYVKLKDVPTANHNEHSALARAVLSQMSGLAAYNFSDKVDICGGNMWVWHRKMEGTDGLKLIKTGTVLEHVPENWRENIGVVARRVKRLVPKSIEESTMTDEFSELIDKKTKTPLELSHKRLLHWFEDHKCQWWWDRDNHLMVCHTFDLKQAHTELKLIGVFETVSTGKDAGTDHNAFCFPVRNGGWTVRRFGRGVTEAPTWSADAKGWTKCYYNMVPSLASLAAQFNASETLKEGYLFRTVDQARSALKHHNVDLGLPEHVHNRRISVKELNGRDRIALTINRENDDSPEKFGAGGWTESKNNWVKITSYNPPVKINENIEVDNLDDTLRHVVSATGDDRGWRLKVGGAWREEPLQHIKFVLQNMNFATKDIGRLIGEAVSNGWQLVNQPFKPLYPGNRQWNLNTAQLRCIPSTNLDNLSFPTWKLLFDHCGNSLTPTIETHEWCMKNGIKTGSDYLMLWVSSLIQFPQRPLPYLFFYGPQDSGKSSFHEMIVEFLIKDAHTRASAALTSDSTFNAELEKAILCIVEEVDLRKKEAEAYNRIKEWVTSPELLVHVKGKTPYTMANYTKWIQTANDGSYCPIFPGDTRIVMSYVPVPERIIPKDDLRKALEKEAPDFLAHLLHIEIPNSETRLGLPCINTPDKEAAADSTLSELEQFIKIQGLDRQGHSVRCKDFIDAFIIWLPMESQGVWNNTKIGKTLAKLHKYPKGRVSRGGIDQYYGNLSLDPTAVAHEIKLVPRNGFLTPERVVLSPISVEQNTTLKAENHG